MKGIFAFFVMGVISLVQVNAAKNQPIPADHPLLRYTGRIDNSNPKSLRFTYPGVSISAKFESPFFIVKLKNKSIGIDEDGNPYKNYYQIIVDGVPKKVLGVADGQSTHRIELGPGVHTLTIFKRTESSVGEGIFEGLEIVQGKDLLPITPDHKLKIEFIGNSITCGYGIEGKDQYCKFSPETENNYLAYGALTARNLQAEYVAVAFSGKGMYQNYDTTDKQTMPMLYGRTIPFENQLVWDFNRWKPDLVVINVGTNDFAHVAPPQQGFVMAYVGFLKSIRKNYPSAKIVCTLGPMTSDFWPVGVKALTTSKKYIDLAVKEFGDPLVTTFYFTPQKTEDFGCDFHPNIGRHQLMAQELTEFLQKFIAK
ncbi:MAG: hypothetical protein K2Q22_04770 [Cytophagales bacterium]|nr:hypothetical protein [Cytophagales bacterium]